MKIVKNVSAKLGRAMRRAITDVCNDLDLLSSRETAFTIDLGKSKFGFKHVIRIDVGCTRESIYPKKPNL